MTMVGCKQSMSVCFGDGVCVDTEAGDGQQDGEGGGDAMACSCDDAILHTEAAAKLHDAKSPSTVVRPTPSVASIMFLPRCPCKMLAGLPSSTLPSLPAGLLLLRSPSRNFTPLRFSSIYYWPVLCEDGPLH